MKPCSMNLYIQKNYYRYSCLQLECDFKEMKRDNNEMKGNNTEITDSHNTTCAREKHARYDKGFKLFSQNYGIRNFVSDGNPNESFNNVRSRIPKFRCIKQ